VFGTINSFINGWITKTSSIYFIATITQYFKNIGASRGV
jgi:hypothetical protein